MFENSSINIRPLLLQIVLLFLLAIWLHAPATEQWLWDDELLIAANQDLSSVNKLFSMWSEDLWAGAPGEQLHSWYRPLVILSFWIDQNLVPDLPIAAKWHSVFWHLAAVILTWQVMRPWVPNAHARMLGLSFIAVHPCTLELTQFVSARNDSMAAVGLLGTFLFAAKQRFLLVFVAVLFALLSKESSLFTLILFGIYWISQKQLSTKLLSSVLGGILIWTMLRINASLESPPSIEPLWTAFIHYLGCFSVPSLCPVALPASDLELTWTPVLSLAILLALLYKAPASCWIAGAFAIAQLGLAVVGTSVSHGLPHRYLYPSLIGFSILIACRFNKNATSGNWIALFIPLLIGSYFTKPRWKSTVDIWEHAWQTQKSQLVACALFKSYEQINQPQKALPMLTYSLKPPPVVHCCFNATRYTFMMGDVQKTLTLGQLALENGCEASPELISPLAMSQALNGQWASAEQHMRSLNSDPFGFRPVLLSAAALRRGDESELSKWAPGQEDALKEKARALIKQANQTSMQK